MHLEKSVAKLQMEPGNEGVQFMRWVQEKEQTEQQQGQMASPRTTTEQVADASWILNGETKDNRDQA